MQLSLDIIDSLRETAVYIAGYLREVNITPNKFWDASNSLPRYKLTQNQLICYSGDGEIAFRDIRPSKVLSLEIEPPVEFNTERQSYVLDTYTNAGSTPITEEETYTEEHSESHKTDILAELSTSIKGKISGSYAGFSAELETQLSAKLGVNHSKEETHKQGTTKKLGITVPPWTKVSLSQEHNISDVSEKITLVCEIDAGIILDGGWTKSFDSLNELTLYMRGGGGGTGETQDLDNFVNTRKFEGFDLDEDVWFMPNRRRVFEIRKERISRNVSTGKIERTETEIEHGGI